MTRLSNRRGKVAIRMMITLLATMVVVGVVQYLAVDRAMTRRALSQLATAHESDARVVRSLYEGSTAHDPLAGARELLNHVATRPGVLRVALIAADGTVAAVGQQGHGPQEAVTAGHTAATTPAMPAMADKAGHPTMTQQAGDVQAPPIHGTSPGRTMGERVDDEALQVVQKVTRSLSSDTRLGADELQAIVTVPVTLGSVTHAFEIVRSTADLRQQLADLRWTLLGTLALGLPFGLAIFYLAGARRYSTRLHRALEDSATDGLTGLRNHREFHEELHRRIELARRHGRPLALALIDLDGFKTVNDTHGHRAGDRVLARMGLVLRDGRPEDLPFRTGGDEFAVLLPETDLDGGQVVAERIRQQVQDHIDGVTASIGVAAFSIDAPDADALVHSADAALYTAKRHGRNQVVPAATGQEHARAAATR